MGGWREGGQFIGLVKDGEKTRKIKYTFLTGGGALRAERKSSKTLCFLGKAMTINF